MRIAVLTTYFDPEENGLTRYINGLYGALLEKHPEIEVDVIAFDTLRTKKYKQKAKNWMIYRIDCIPILGGTYAIPTKKGRKQLHEIFQKNSYDIINTHTRFFLTSYYGMRFGKKHRTPLVHTEHGSGFVKHQSKIVELIAKAYDLTLGKYTLKNAALVCGVSQSACRFAKKLGAKKTEVIFNGIDLNFWCETRNEKLETRKRLGIKSDEVVYTFVGRLIPEKGVQDLIEVLREIKGISWKLLVVGDGFYRNELENLVKKHQLENKILFLGTKGQKEIRDILNITDLFINPSLASEGLPTTILEAAGCGMRVLSSDKGGSVEVLGKENLFPAGNSEELKKKILDYKKLPIPKVEKFNWKNISDKYYEIISAINKTA
jgi:glycosyltransferase involved in cell wall biosynthesis